jgi:hypothetical protein
MADQFYMLIQTEQYDNAKRILSDNGAPLRGRIWGKRLMR